MSTDNDNSALVNPELTKLQTSLFALNDDLRGKFNATTDIDLQQAIVTEMQEVMHRIDLVQGLIFADESKRLSSLVSKVDDANETLQQNLQDIDSITDLVKTVANFLTLVDKAIDFAKTA
jgi:hypothetical protein